MENKKYAPVIIPTLNRYEHFKRCLESLEKCSGAECTDVYVALDYPPSEKYIEGWRKIDAYLYEKEMKNGFKSLTVYRREENYYHTKGNQETAVKDLPKDVEYYITSEDDNEFSPCFLEYQNWALNTFKEDPRIIAVCGFKRVDTSFLTNNVYIYPKFNAWGIGRWVKKNERFQHIYTFENMANYIEQFPLIKIFSKEVVFASSIIGQYCKKVRYGDVLINFIPQENRYCIFPKVSMVRNYGHDGSGQHGVGSAQSYKMYMDNPLESAHYFTPFIDSDLYDKRLEKAYEKAYSIPLKRRIHCMLTVLSYKILKKYI